MEKKKNVKVVEGEIVVDSNDVERARELAVKRGKATVTETEINGKVVAEEILSK